MRIGNPISATAILLALVSQLLPVSNALSQVVINEICSYNGNTIEDEDGSEPDWIELYNAGAAPVNLDQYRITDQSNDPWIFPAINLPPQSYLLVFASGKNRTGPSLHSHFKISREGDVISLYDPSGTLSDRVTIPALHLDHSFGRLPDGGTSQGIFNQPTPGNTNNGMSLFTGYAPDPQFSLPAGFYSGTSLLQITGSSNGEIHYTTDGSIPEITSIGYTAPISISQTTVVRAVNFSTLPDVLPSEVITNTYLINYLTTLPVFSIATHPDNFWDWNTGIYVSGPNASPVYPYYGANFWQNWEIETHVEFFETNKTRKIAQNAGVEIHGGTSNRSKPMKSLRLSAKNKYGTTTFEHRFFDQKNIRSFKNIVLRNSSFDFNKTHFRDGSLHELMIGKLNIDLEAYRPAAVFLNGVYFGVHNIREKISEYYPAENHGVNPDSLDLLEEDSIVLAGNFNAFNAMHSFITGNNMAVKSNFDAAAAMIDTESLCDYYIGETYLSNIDWPYNNMKYWKSYESGSRWRYILMDLDVSLGTNGWAPASFDVLGRVMGPYGDTSRHVQIFRSLLQNFEFKEYFINRYADVANTLFTPENMRNHILKVRDRIAGEMPLHFLKWGNDMQGWDQEIFNVVMSYIDQRPAYAMEQVRNVFNLAGIHELEINVWPPGAGTIQVNTIRPTPLPWKGNYFDGNTITLRVITNPGFTFAGWISDPVQLSDSKNLQIRVNPDTINRFTAVFNLDSNSDPLQVFPNPAAKEAEAGCILHQAGRASLQITDAAGKVVVHMSDVTVTEGLNLFKFDVSGLRSGFYLIRLITGDSVLSSRLSVI